MTDRKARLAALAAKAGRTKNDDETEEDKSRPVNFRNYTPKDASLEATTTEPAAKRSKTEGEEKSILERALEKAKAESSDVANVEEDVVAVAPKKINWDLKRDIQPKLDRLERRTQRAIVEMLRERLEKEAEEDLD